MADLTPLRNLNGSRGDYRIRVNLARVWFDAGCQDLCFILRDIFGTRIGGSSPARLFHRFRDMITREGYWLDIVKFRVERAVPWKTSSHQFQIRLSEETILDWDDEHHLVGRSYDFVPLASIRLAVCNIGSPIDLMGAITVVKPLRKWSSPRAWPEPWYTRSSIEFTITDHEKQSVDCIAYADHAEVLSERWISSAKTFIICALVSVRVLEVEGSGTVELDPTRSIIVYDRSIIPGYDIFERLYNESNEEAQSSDGDSNEEAHSSDGDQSASS